MSPAEVLRKARTLYEANPSHAPSSESPEKGTECPITAMARVTLGEADAYGPAEVAFMRSIGTTRVPAWNAEHTTAEALAAFDRAIAACEAE